MHYHDIGDYLSRENKLKIIANFVSINGIEAAAKWTTLHPNAEHDWINQRDPAFEKFIVLGDKDDDKAPRFFENYSQGLLTARDRWCYSFSSKSVSSNMARMIDFYNGEVEKANVAVSAADKAERTQVFESIVECDSKQIAWSGNLKADGVRGKKHKFLRENVVGGIYRPFNKQACYFDRNFNERVYQLPTIFPGAKLPNIGIFVTGSGASKGFSALAVDFLPNFHFHDTGQCFPLYLYEPIDDDKPTELARPGYKVIDTYRRREAITDTILKTFRDAYAPKLTKEDIFYYVYGILHSPEYRTRFAADLKKMLPRIPLTKEARDFAAFSQAGRKLADWHLNYETVKPWPVQEHNARFEQSEPDPHNYYHVQKMTFARPTPEQKLAGEKWNKSTIIYNADITITKIPLEAYEYVVNGKPAIEWIMERYQYTRDKDSGIVNDPNDWSREHNQPRYIIDLLMRVVRVSIETMKIVKALPPLNERK